MRNFLDKIFFRSNNLDDLSKKIKDIKKNTPVGKIFKAINSFSSNSELMYVGGCLRKIINNEVYDDIDLATNLKPEQTCDALKRNEISFYESGKEHGTITATSGEYKFEITSLREDINTDGRHADVRFSNDWKKDSSRRDFTINSIYSDVEGNLFDPYDGKTDLENGDVIFIGDPDKSIKEDYLRILRYFRFFLIYSKHPHKPEVIKKIKKNLGGVSKLSKERLLDELKKILQLNTLERLSKDKFCLETFLIIFPEVKNLNLFNKLNPNKREILKNSDLTFLISLLVIDNKDNADYFIFKYNISKKDRKRIKIIDNFFKENINSKIFTEQNLNKIFYYYGNQAVMDIINFKIITSKKNDLDLFELSEIFKNKKIPIMPIKAEILISKYNIPEGKQLGVKLKIIEKEWVNNNFQLSDTQVDNIIKS